MTNTFDSVVSLSDDLLVAEIKALAAHERDVTARLIAALAELDERRLYLGAGCPSLFVYCTRVLRLSEHAAYGRIEAARASRRFPRILDLLTDGSLTLTSVCLLRPLLNDGNADRLLDAARHKSKRDVEHLVASERPLPPVPSSVRKLPAAAVSPSPSCSPQHKGSAPAAPAQPSIAPALCAPPRLSVVTPLAPERYKVQFTISPETREKLRRVQDLLRHTIPNGDVSLIFDRALTMLLDDLERKRLALVQRPRNERAPTRDSGSRHIPAAVRRQVGARDNGRCSFVGVAGPCGERGMLQFHHVVPYADGGAATVDNIQLRCAAHNRYEAVLWSGAEAPMVRERPDACEW